MGTKIRLLARCQMHGEVREPGYTFEMPEFETIEQAQEYLTNLPHTVADHGNPRAANIRADLHGTSIDAVTGGQYVGPIQMPVQNVPLFEIIGGEIELKAAAPVPHVPPDPSMVILPSGPEQAQPLVPLTADHETGALLPPVGAGPLVTSDKPAEAGTAAEGAGGAVTSQAESGEKVEPVERIEDGQEQAEGEAHHDDGDAA